MPIDVQRATMLETEKEKLNAEKDKFYGLLSFTKVVRFPAEASQAEIDALKVEIDQGQAITEKLSKMRFLLSSTFTAERLEDMDRATLERIATTNSIKFTAKTKTATLRKKLVGKNISIRPKSDVARMFSVLREARAKANYPHPKQTE